MERVEVASLRRSPPGRSQSSWRGFAFGLHLEADFEIPCVHPVVEEPGSRGAVLRLVPRTAISRWPKGARPVIDRRFHDGRLMLKVERHEELGYRVYAPHHGAYLISGDGKDVQLAVTRVPSWKWQRLLFAQVLPLSAALQGVELFHASAVALHGQALAFIAPAGTGKTSIAAHLVARGASLVTDDALALEPANDGVSAHPGGTMASLDERELAAMTAAGRARLGPVIGRSDKLHVAVAEASTRPLRLGAAYFLTRSSGPGELEIVTAWPPDPRLLLSSRFVPHERGPEHLLHHLDVAARVARTARLYQVSVPGGVPAEAVARGIEAHAEASLAERAP